MWELSPIDYTLFLYDKILILHILVKKSFTLLRQIVWVM
jgi:hypothetical protein